MSTPIRLAILPAVSTPAQADAARFLVSAESWGKVAIVFVIARAPMVAWNQINKARRIPSTEPHRL